MTTMTSPARAERGPGLEGPSIVDVLNHEIRTPLAILMGHVELLSELALGELGVGDQAARAVTAIAAAADRLAEVADALSRMADTDGIEADFLRTRPSSPTFPATWLTPCAPGNADAIAPHETRVQIVRAPQVAPLVVAVGECARAGSKGERPRGRTLLLADRARR